MKKIPGPSIARSSHKHASRLNPPPDIATDSRAAILIAEDDPATRELLRAILTRAQFTVYAVENGKLACEAVRLWRPDVIVLDWMMPVMNGLRAAQRLKADSATRAIPIVMITTNSEIADRDLALNVGVQDFVTKPFDPSELVRCIDQQTRWRTIIETARTVDRRLTIDAGPPG